MKAGTFKAIAIDNTVTKTKNDQPQIVIQLEIDFEEGKKRVMNYYGSLSDKAVEFSLKALVACGIQGNSLFDKVTKGTEVTVVVDHQLDENGKERFDDKGNPLFKISWVNSKPSMGTSIDENIGRQTLKKYEGHLMKLRKNSSPQIKNHAPQSSEDVPWPSNEEIPF